MALKRALSLLDAVNINLGTIIGGIFVIIGHAAGLAGPAVVISVIAAGIVALLTGLTSARLSELIPKGGGVYEYAKVIFSERVGFAVGWLWLFTNIAVGATVAIGFGQYLGVFLPWMPANAAAVALILLVCAINLFGTAVSGKFNDILVLIIIAILLLFSGASAASFEMANLEPFAPFGISGILGGAAIIFFAYAGSARVTVVADEVKDPKRNVHLAIILSIGIATLLYLLVSITAIGAGGYGTLAGSDSPLSSIMELAGIASGHLLVSFGALIATATVVLSSVIGVSVLMYIMGRSGEFPKALGQVDPRTSAPRNAIIISGLGMLVFASFGQLGHAASISSFSLLFYYGILNLGGAKFLKGWWRNAAILGLLSCIALMSGLPPVYWGIGIGVILIGAAYHALFVGKEKNGKIMNQNSRSSS